MGLYVTFFFVPMDRLFTSFVSGYYGTTLLRSLYSAAYLEVASFVRILPFKALPALPAWEDGMDALVCRGLDCQY